MSRLASAAARKAPIAPYEPVGALKPVAANIWIVDGAPIEYPRGTGLMFPTRMTLVRLPTGALFVHSPVALSAELRSEVEALGQPRYIVGPNRLHYWWIPEWRDAFPDASVYVAPRLLKHAGAHLGFRGSVLDRESGHPWDLYIRTLPVAGRFMTEVVFFHVESRTLLLTDLVENFERDRIGSRLMRLLVRWGGVEAPDGQTPRDLRLTYQRDKLREAVERMIAWEPERIIIAHGRLFSSQGVAELKRAFRWLL